MDDSETSVVNQAEGELTKARTAVAKVPAAERVTLSRRLGTLESDLTGAKESRTGAMTRKANRMRAEAEAVYAGIAPYADVNDDPAKRVAIFGDQGIDVDHAAGTTLKVTVGQLDAVDLKEDKTVTVMAPEGWKGAKYTLTDGGTTYEAMAYDNRYPSRLGKPFRVAWKDELTDDGILPGANVQAADDVMIDAELVAGPKPLAPAGETYKVRGTFAGVPGEFFCTPRLRQEMRSAAKCRRLSYLG